ncbi:hypothetical protein C9374_010885 [Naegleria lovaniensis]|uniref:protein-tyrosine-phosphatase n=1 Tax=Naegleria lovaniensis TaxID=51637 RepID=A0AA88KD06_NAELO|nr:uncharacterized protein C9374_010885 [Naegleria lovaniensis]KAG2374315.1 hypothetical protein C9374_010885 [Naegleria lovaniensis]
MKQAQGKKATSALVVVPPSTCLHDQVTCFQRPNTYPTSPIHLPCSSSSTRSHSHEYIHKNIPSTTVLNEYTLSSFLSRQALIQYMVHEPYSTLIIDCRDRKNFEKSHIMTSIQSCHLRWDIIFREDSILTCQVATTSHWYQQQQQQQQQQLYYHEQILFKCKDYYERIVLVMDTMWLADEKNLMMNKENRNIEMEEWNGKTNRSSSSTTFTKSKKPRVYLLEGGFSEFYHHHSNLCWNLETMKEFCMHEPQKEIQMVMRKEEENSFHHHHGTAEDHDTMVVVHREKSNGSTITFNPVHCDLLIPHFSQQEGVTLTTNTFNTSTMNTMNTMNNMNTMNTMNTTTTSLPSMEARIRNAHQLIFSNLSQRVTCEKPTKLFANLFLGNVQNSMNIQQLSELGVTCIINAALECENVFENSHSLPVNCTNNNQRLPTDALSLHNNGVGVNIKDDHTNMDHIHNHTISTSIVNPHRILYCNIPVRDSEDENISLYFEKCFQFIEMAKREQRKVLVHCFMGMSRSACLVVACLMKFKEWSLEKAFQYVKKKRPSIEINCGFMKQLVELETKLFKDRVHTPTKETTPLMNGNNTTAVITSATSHCSSLKDDTSRHMLLAVTKRSSSKKISEFIHEQQHEDQSFVMARGGDVTPPSFSPPTHPQTPPNHFANFEDQFESKHDD